MVARSRIVTLHQTGHQLHEIAAQVNCSIKTVRHWIRTHQAGGDAALRDHRQFNLGLRKTTADQDDEIRDYILNINPFVASTTIRNDIELEIAPATLRRRLHEINYINGKPAKKTALTQQHRDERIGYALQYYQEDEDFWRNTVCLDEKTFSSSEDGRSLVWRPRGERFNSDFVVHHYHSGRISCGIWGFITTRGVGEIIEVNARMNAEQYVYILENHFLPNVRRILPRNEFEEIKVIEDRSGVHRARATLRWYENHPEITLLPHPPKSPDLNGIENVWSYMVKTFRSGETELDRLLLITCTVHGRN